MKTSLKRIRTHSTHNAYNDRSNYNTYNVYDTFCLFPPLVLNPGVLLIMSLNQGSRYESCQSRVLALIMKCKSVKK